METFLRFSPLLLVSSIVLFAIGLSVNHDKENITKAEITYLASLQKIDSLKNVTDSLQSEIYILEDGFDSKEHRYEDVLLDYEVGLSYLKDYHPTAYKDFHRIIGMREHYSHQLERENKNRLKINKL